MAVSCTNLTSQKSKPIEAIAVHEVNTEIETTFYNWGAYWILTTITGLPSSLERATIRALSVQFIRRICITDGLA